MKKARRILLNKSKHPVLIELGEHCAVLADANAERLAAAKSEEREAIVKGWLDKADIFCALWKTGNDRHIAIIKGERVLSDMSRGIFPEKGRAEGNAIWVAGKKEADEMRRTFKLRLLH
jgi:hypothetical protein